MSKKTIRLTESDLKKYISKVVSEQTSAPVGGGSNSQQKGMGLKRGINTDLLNPLVGKVASLFRDVNKSQLAAKIKITEAKPLNDSVIRIKGDDLSMVNQTTGEMNKSFGKIEVYLMCKQKELYAFEMDPSTGKSHGAIGAGKVQKNKPSVVVYCPSLKKILMNSLGCIDAVTNTKSDFTSVDGAPDQTGTSTLSEGKKKVVRLTESELKRYISKIISK